MTKRIFTIKYEALITQNKPGETLFWFSLPQNDNYQKVLNTEVNREHLSEYFTKENAIRFYRSREKDFRFTAIIKVELQKDASFSNREISFIQANGKSENEPYLNNDQLTTKVTMKLQGDDNTKLRGLMDFINEKFEYCYPVKYRGVENLRIDNLSGDCGEYSALFVASARELGISARNETGFVLYPKEKTIREHGWASCLTTDGWKDFDPQYSQLDNDIDKYFGRRDDYRIIFCHGFNQKLLPRIPDSYSLEFWKELGLPATKDAVQIMQPIFFACENNFEFQEEISIA